MVPLVTYNVPILNKLREEPAFLPAEAHVSQNPVFVVVEVDLSRRREEGVSQFSCDAVETMVQVGLQTVCVVDGVEACQEPDGHRQLIMRAVCRPQPAHDGLQQTHPTPQPFLHCLQPFMNKTLVSAATGTDKELLRPLDMEVVRD